MKRFMSCRLFQGDNLYGGRKMSKTQKAVVLGTRKGLLIFAKNGNGWKLINESFLGVAVSYAFMDRRNSTLWACLDHGHWGAKLHKSTDFGKSWVEIPSPKYPEWAKVKEETPATLKYLWVMERGHESEPETLYIGTEPGGLFKSTDGGETFDLVTSLWNHPSREDQWFGGGRDTPGIHSIIVNPTNKDHILVGISCAGVFETKDGGNSWNPKNKGLNATFLPNPQAEVGHDAHFIAQCIEKPEHIWQQNHCGIFKSVDGAETWTAVSDEKGTPHFGFTCAVDESNPDLAWVIPATSDEKRVSLNRALCVCRTEDGGKSWKDLRHGLPQENCYDFAYRHGLANEKGFLAFGTSTGSLYVSEDHGDSWTTLGEHLPPVYSVRIC
jgi:photosystem II stability/assembly factor-like uncharacterized protein